MKFIKIESVLAVHEAVEQNNIEYLRYLIGQGHYLEFYDFENKTPLHRAIENNSNPQIIELLLNHGALVEARTKHGLTPLHLCAIKKNSQVAKTLLTRYKADPNSTDKRRKTPLFHAIKSNDPQLVQILLQNRSNPNIKNNQGVTPIFEAILQEHLEIIEILLQFGVDINTRSNENLTLFRIAAYTLNPKIFDIFLKFRINLNIRDLNGRTPLHYLSNNINSTECMEFLLRRGANVNMLDFEKKSPLYHALQSGLKSNVAFLLDFGASVYFNEYLIVELKEKAKYSMHVQDCLYDFVKRLIQLQVRGLLDQNMFLIWKDIVIKESEYLKKYETTCEEENEKMRKNLLEFLV